MRNKISIDTVDVILSIFSLDSNYHNFFPMENIIMKFNSATVYATDLSGDDRKLSKPFQNKLLNVIIELN